MSNAERLADEHRARFGDDCIQHLSQTTGNGLLACEDCGWAVVDDDYADDGEYDWQDDDDEVTP